MNRRRARESVELPPQHKFDAEQIRRKGLREFVRRAWRLVDTSPLRWNWHLDAICEHLEAVTRRESQDLVINVPPGMSKSLITSVLWPAWAWTIDPQHRWITTSYSDDLALRDSRKHRTLVSQKWYADCFGIALPRGIDASTAVSFWHTDAGGFRYATSVRGQVTGQHCDTFVVDDPVDPMGANSSSGVELDEVARWWSETVPTRFRDQPTSARVLIMQRLHERDLSSIMAASGATVLCLPMRYEPDHPHVYARDPRTQRGELLMPERYPEEVVAKLERVLGPYGTAAQLQQRPTPAGGGVFQRRWLERYWIELPRTGTYVQSWDLSFGGTRASNSRVAGQVWLHSGADYYLVDAICEHLDFVQTCEAIRAMSARWPNAHAKLVENKANGPAVISQLRNEVSGIVGVEPEGGKIARANAVQAFFAAGNVYLPDPERAQYADGRRGASWVPEYQRTLGAFPNGDYDDPVDATTQALAYMGPSMADRYARAMANAFKR